MEIQRGPTPPKEIAGLILLYSPIVIVQKTLDPKQRVQFPYHTVDGKKILHHLRLVIGW